MYITTDKLEEPSLQKEWIGSMYMLGPVSNVVKIAKFFKKYFHTTVASNDKILST